MGYSFRKKDVQVSDYVKKVDSQDLLLNKASKNTIAESYLGCYDIYDTNSPMKEMYMLIIPDIIVNSMIKMKVDAREKITNDCEECKEELVLDEKEYADFEHTRFTIDKYEYIGDSTEDILLEKYISQIDPYDDDSDLAKLLKETMSRHIHITNDEKRKYWLTQLYSRVRRQNTPVEDKNSLYNKMKMLEQFSEEGVYVTTKVRGLDGRLEEITYQVKL